MSYNYFKFLNNNSLWDQLLETRSFPNDTIAIFEYDEKNSSFDLLGYKNEGEVESNISNPVENGKPIYVTNFSTEIEAIFQNLWCENVFWNPSRYREELQKMAEIFLKQEFRDIPKTYSSNNTKSHGEDFETAIEYYKNVDIDKSIEFFKKCDDYHLALYNLGYLYSSNKNDFKTGLSYFKKACKKGNVDSFFYAGLMIYNGEKGINKNEKLGISMIYYSAKNGFKLGIEFMIDHTTQIMNLLNIY